MKLHVTSYSDILIVILKKTTRITYVCEKAIQ
jgi:hypothetical protein